MITRRKRAAKALKSGASSKRLNPRVLRELEAHISDLEDQIREVSQKLEKPLNATESVAELGRLYVDLKMELDSSWEAWEKIFSD